MAHFERTCSCPECGREYVVQGTAANPGNETQVPAEFPCVCGGWLFAFLPGSVNRERLVLVPKLG